uniref:Pept_C1 domain-containing protein n=1 Tax=Haemonchus contortus TaxID=6289 RepID=A0A7I5E595_HAECO
KFFTLALYVCLCQADVVTTRKIPVEAQRLSGEPLVEYLRKNQDLFEVNPDPTPDFELKIMDKKFATKNINYIVKDGNDTGEDIPEEYDPRTIWTNCTSLFTIRDQANCGSCWAISTAAAISDRICIATKAEKQVNISATDIIACCSYCGAGCQGGWVLDAWRFFVDDGIVSGGNYNNKEGCRPYPYHPCGHHGNETYYGKCNGTAPNPQCRKTCIAGVRKQYRVDKRYGKTAYKLPPSVKAIQREVLEHGPVVVSFEVYEDFGHYKSGIYKHTAGEIRGHHAVKLIGWGKENGTDYWIIANSWHDDWGEQGFFRIVRGINECGIEEAGTAGLVDIDTL